MNINNSTGLEIKPYKSEEIKKAVFLISNNRKLRKKFECNAYKRYLKYFILKKMIDTYTNLFFNIHRQNNLFTNVSL